MSERLSRKSEKLLGLFEDHLFASYAEKTAKGVLRGARLFLGWIQQRRVAVVEVRAADVEAYQSHVCTLRQKDDTPYSIAEQTHWIASVKKLFRFLCQRGYLLSDPSGAVRYPRPEKRLPHTILTRTEARRLVEAITAQTPLALRDRAILVRTVRVRSAMLRFSYQAALQTRKKADLVLDTLDVSSLYSASLPGLVLRPTRRPSAAPWGRLAFPRRYPL